MFVFNNKFRLLFPAVLVMFSACIMESSAQTKVLDVAQLSPKSLPLTTLYLNDANKGFPLIVPVVAPGGGPTDPMRRRTYSFLSPDGGPTDPPQFTSFSSTLRLLGGPTEPPKYSIVLVSLISPAGPTDPPQYGFGRALKFSQISKPDHDPRNGPTDPSGPAFSRPLRFIEIFRSDKSNKRIDGPTDPPGKL